MRVVPELDLRGCAFQGPGVDLGPDEVSETMTRAAPLVAWLNELEPGVALRSLSLDVERPRLLVTTVPASPDERPRAVRLEGAAAEEAVRRASDLLTWLAERAAERLARRSS